MHERREVGMQIGAVAKKVGVSVDAIRFYERSRLLEAPPRSEGGFRRYSADHISALVFILSLQTLGFSLNEIRDFLSLRTNDLRACSEVRGMLDRKLNDIRTKRVALSKLERELKGALNKCDSQLQRRRQNVQCPVLAVSRKSSSKDRA